MVVSRIARCIPLFSLLVLMVATGVRAQGADFKFSGKPIYVESIEIEDDRKRDNWTGRLGAGFSLLPNFRGSNDYDSRVSVDVKVSYRDTIFLENNKLGAVLYDKRLLRAGVIGRWTTGRRADFASSGIDGVVDVDDGLELGFFAGTGLYKLFLTAEAYFGVSGPHRGSTVELEAGYTFELNSKLRLTPILGLEWGSADYMRAYFGVPEATENLPAFRPGAAVYEIYSEFSLEQRLTKDWLLKGTLRLSDLREDAARSPLVSGEQGARAQVSTFLGVVWLF